MVISPLGLTVETTGEVFKGDLQLRISHGSSHQMYFQIHKSGGQSNSMYINTQALQSTICAFIEIDSTGDNIRMGLEEMARVLLKETSLL